MLAVALAGCSGDDHRGAAAGRGGSGAEAGGGSGGLQTVDPGTVGMHRLNSTEYNATVADVLGTTLQPASDSWRGGELAGFDNIASVLGVDEAQYERYFEAAGALATDVMASDGLRGRFVRCDLTDSACVTSSISAAGLRILRRPVDPDELQTYRRVYDSARESGDDENAAFTLVLQTLLSSAEFLYRIELDPAPSSTEPHPVGPFELASRLSYFLWSSAPDDALLQVAAQGSLAEPDVLSTTVDRLLADPKSERFVTNFAGQWLGARQVLSHAVASNFPHWLPQTAEAASQEILLYFGDFVKSGRSWFDFPTADVNFVDGPLAYFYGIPTDAMSVGVFHRVEYPDDQRAGFFGLAGFLAVTSLDTRTSPPRRGRWVAGTLLCREPPPPPPVIPMLDAAPEGAGAGSVRASLERHRTEPSCFGCHSTFDPYGLALENFDAIGKYRTTYGDGTPVDAEVTLPPSPPSYAEVTVNGPDDLARAVSADPDLGACLGRKLLTYGLGRAMTAKDEGHLAQAQADWLQPGQTPSVDRLIHALVATRAFLFRRAETEGSAAR